MAHQNSAKVEAGILTVDRKFHVGMMAYAKGISTPLLTINPENRGEAIMDPVRIAVDQLSYQIHTVKVDPSGNPAASELPGLTNIVAASKLAYGNGLTVPAVARQVGIPYIPILEYDLQTRVIVATADVTNPLRRAVRIARTALDYHKSLEGLRHAHSLHCNGYPIYDATKSYNSKSLLYFDSRMSGDMLISRAELSARLAKKRPPLRLLYSGRYERMKGSLDAVTVAANCLQQGLEIEMHCYGQGSLKSEMVNMANRWDGRIKIHDAVPYTELVNISRGFDVFVCCHIQNDPSCTYLESFGAGLPIVGYANRMWRRLCEESGAGLDSPVGDTAKVAGNIGRLIADPDMLADVSWKALAFASAHCYENEWAKRIEALNAAMAS